VGCIIVRCGERCRWSFVVSSRLGGARRGVGRPFPCPSALSVVVVVVVLPAGERVDTAADAPISDSDVCDVAVDSEEGAEGDTDDASRRRAGRRGTASGGITGRAGAGEV